MKKEDAVADLEQSEKNRGREQGGELQFRETLGDGVSIVRRHTSKGIAVRVVESFRHAIPSAVSQE